MTTQQQRSRGSENLKDIFTRTSSREFIEDLLKNDGDFLVRKASKGKSFVVSTFWKGIVRHCIVVENHDPKVGLTYTLGVQAFSSMDDLIYYHYRNEIALGDASQTMLLTPVKCPKTKYKEDDVEVMEKLGGGNYGDVFKVRIKGEGLICAMKTLKGDVNLTTRESFRGELELMKMMHHDNVVQYIGMVVPATPADRTIKILLEMINQGSLDKLLARSKVKERGKLKVCCQVAKGMQYLHKHHIIHRDLAARNILVQVDPDHGSILAKVSDFGLSRTDDSGHGYALKTAHKLPLKWLAPECFNNKCWTTASDVWSFGILMCEVFTNGKEPYFDTANLPNDPANLQRFIGAVNHPNRPAEIRDDVWRLMTSCWTLDVKKRPSMDKIVEELEKIYKQL